MVRLVNKKAAQKFALLILALLSTFAGAASEDDSETARWFTIEVIVFKTTGGQGYTAESWDKSVSLTKPSNLIDFLQPFAVREAEELALADSQALSNATNDPLATAKSAVNKTTSAPTLKQNAASDQASLVGSDFAEKPFTKLAEEFRQLSNEATSLSRHPEYRVIFHEAWRQPVYDSASAPSVRIAGGEDFSDRFDYDGLKKLATFEFGYDPANDTALEVVEDFSEISTPENNLAITATNQELEPAGEDLTAEPEMVPLPWVPELDGDIQIYLSRYLHIRTNLFLRHPEKEEVDVIDPQMLLQSNLEPLQTSPSNLFGEVPESIIDPTKKPTPGVTDQPLSPLTMDSPFSINQKTLPQNNLLVTRESQFSWEIDDNFLETESEKMYIERLFNFPLTQSRRVKSGELHYFDHPLMGILILITPYESEKELTQTDGILPPSI